MSDFKSPTSMAHTLCQWGMEPSTVHSMVTYQFGFAPNIEKIRKYAGHLKEQDQKRVEREQRNPPLGNSDEGHAKMMIHSNAIFVARLWREIRAIQARKALSNG